MTAFILLVGAIWGFAIAVTAVDAHAERAALANLARLTDGDQWAADNGYGPARLDEATETWLFPAPEFIDPATPIADSIDFQLWEQEVAP